MNSREERSEDPLCRCELGQWPGGEPVRASAQRSLDPRPVERVGQAERLNTASFNSSSGDKEAKEGRTHEARLSCVHARAPVGAPGRVEQRAHVRGGRAAEIRTRLTVDRFEGAANSIQ